MINLCKFDKLEESLLACADVVSSDPKHSETFTHGDKELKHKIDASGKPKDSEVLCDINTKLSIVTEKIDDENKRKLISK